jgi:hypothetical protein
MRLLSAAVPYLLLVSFHSGEINNFTTDKIKVINESPYHGVAVSLINAYDTVKHVEKDFEAATKLLKANCKKHVWPWVYFNRFIGYREGGKSLVPLLAKVPYFQNIKGMDIYNESGALDDFYDIWRISLRIAKELGSPGIIVDAETYNNYDNYNLASLSKQVGKGEDEVKERLQGLGAELIDIAEREYPQAALWFLFTGLGSPVRSLSSLGKKEYRTVTYITQGMLEKAKRNKSKLSIISGGEISLGYCYDSLDELRSKIAKREQDFSSVLRLYSNLNLGGTIAPWDKVGLKRDWMSKGKCGSSSLGSVDDFKPLIGHLLRSYNYVWIYATGSAGYNPYDTEVSPGYHRAIREVLIGRK